MKKTADMDVEAFPQGIASAKKTFGVKTIGGQGLGGQGAFAHQLKGPALKGVGGDYRVSTVTADDLLATRAKTGDDLEVLTEEVRALAELCGQECVGVSQET